VDAVSSHGGKAQEEREAAMKDFKFGRADVLIATDVAAKVSFVFRHLMTHARA
jgi:superfamily II DNA/RNA helicase